MKCFNCGKESLAIEKLSSNFYRIQCDNCGSTNNLTIHHLIPRYVRNFMEKYKYLSQRHFWANKVVLCKRCHAEIHGLDKSFEEKMGVISKDKIDKIKKEYGIK